MDNNKSQSISCDFLHEIVDEAPLEAGAAHPKEKSAYVLIGARIIGHFVDYPEAGDSNHPGR